MNDKVRLTGLRVVLIIACLSHLAIGIGIIVGGTAAVEFMGRVYGAGTIPVAPEFLYILKPLGAYMITIGVLAAAAIYDPWNHRVVVYGIALLLLLRVLQRVVYGGEAQELFELTTARLVGQSMLFLGMALALLVFRPMPTVRSSK